MPKLVSIVAPVVEALHAETMLLLLGVLDGGDRRGQIGNHAEGREAVRTRAGGLHLAAGVGASVARTAKKPESVEVQVIVLVVAAAGTAKLPLAIGLSKTLLMVHLSVSAAPERVVKASLILPLIGYMREPSDPGVSIAIWPLPPDAEATCGWPHDMRSAAVALLTACLVKSTAIAAELVPLPEPVLPLVAALVAEAGELPSLPPSQPARARTSVERIKGFFFMAIRT